MSNVNDILRKLSIPKVVPNRTKLKTNKVNLSKLQENVDTYNMLIQEGESNSRTIYQAIDNLLDLITTQLEYQMSLKEVYNVNNDIYQQAVDMGLEDLLPKEVNEISNMDIDEVINNTNNKLELINSLMSISFTA